MSLRYRQEYNEAGDVLDPQTYNLNQNELISEFNGGLDRHNLVTQAIGRNQIVPGAFTNITAFESIVSVPADLTSKTWQSLASYSLTTPVDCAAILEWGSTFQWIGAGYSGTYEEEDACAFRILVDGTELVASPYFGESSEYNSAYLVGALPLPAGAHIFAVQVLVARVRHNNLQISDAAVQSTGLLVAGSVLNVTERRR